MLKTIYWNKNKCKSRDFHIFRSIESLGGSVYPRLKMVELSFVAEWKKKPNTLVHFIYRNNFA